MISLKSYCGPLSEILGMTPDGLYERQRVLVRSGYLSGVVAGKGPGSGVRATPRNVTRLLLSTLATDSLSEIDDRTRKLGALKQVDGKCPITGEIRFQNALESILCNPETSKIVLGIRVRREHTGASVIFRKPGDRRYDQSDFGQRDRLPTDPPPVPVGFGRRITATLEGFSVDMIADDVVDIAAGTPLRVHTPFK
jgi:hypothetical protein